MKNSALIASTFLFFFSFASCNARDNSRNSLDWSGTYRGSFLSSSKDCDGLSLVLEIYEDGRYKQQSACVNNLEEVTHSQGTFTWNKLGNEITLTDEREEQKTTYRVEEMRLRKLSENGKRILYASSEQNILNKITPQQMLGIYWKLVEVKGKKIMQNDSLMRPPHILLHEEGRLSGSAGCNFLNGAYSLNEKGMKISFKSIGVTLMECPDMETEAFFLAALEEVKNYSLSEDGKMLSMKDNAGLVLIRFEADYLRQ